MHEADDEGVGGTGLPLLGTCQKPIPMSWALFESIAKRHVATINGLLPRERVGPSIYPSPGEFPCLMKFPWSIDMPKSLKRQNGKDRQESSQTNEIP